MKALVYTAEKTLSYLDYEDTIQNPNEELIKIDSVGICGYLYAVLLHTMNFDFDNINPCYRTCDIKPAFELAEKMKHQS